MSDQVPGAQLPDMLSLVPEGQAKRVISFCLDTLNLSVSEMDKVLYDSSKLASALDTLLAGGIYRPIAIDRTSPLSS